jgi:hypothetical protein
MGIGPIVFLYPITGKSRSRHPSIPALNGGFTFD